MPINTTTRTKLDNNNDDGDDESKEKSNFNIFNLFQTFADDQRVERLQQCLILEKQLNMCQSKRQELLCGSTLEKKTAATTTTTMEKDETPPKPVGNQIKRNWWGTRQAIPENVTPFEENHPSPLGEEDGVASSERDTTAPVEQRIPTCEKETHAVWACRATSLGCAEHLINLNDCFEEKNPDGCREEQQRMGQCVTKRAAELERRLRDRKKSS